MIWLPLILLAVTWLAFALFFALVWRVTGNAERCIRDLERRLSEAGL